MLESITNLPTILKIVNLYLAGYKLKTEVR